MWQDVAAAMFEAALKIIVWIVGIPLALLAVIAWKRRHQ